jgi:hypothetical protein
MYEVLITVVGTGEGLVNVFRARFDEDPTELLKEVSLDHTCVEWERMVDAVDEDEE